MSRASESERSKLLSRAGIVGAGTLVSRFLGLARDMTLAAVFGREQTDAFFVAFTIPNALRQLLAEGAVSSAVVPMLSAKLATDGDEAAKVFFAKMRGASLVALIAVTVLGVLASRPLVDLFAGGYHDRPAQFERTVQLTRVVFPYIFFMGTAALGMAALNAKKKFAVAAFAPGLLNVAFLVGAFALPGPLERLGIDPAQAMTLGALLGGLLQVAAQWPALRAIGYAGRPLLDLRDPAVREVVRRILPMGAGIGIYYVDLIISRRFLSDLGPGAQSYFSWAMRLCDFPQGIFVMALSTAALPTLASFAARGETVELGKTWSQGMRLSLFVGIPASVMLVVLAQPIVVALFQRGAFDALAARETAKALAWQGGAIWTVAAVRQLVPFFHSIGDTRTPVIVSGIDLLAFLGLAFALRGPWGHAGISAAVAGSSAVQMVLLVVAARRRLGADPLREVAGSALRTLLASVLAAFGAWGVGAALGSFAPHVASSRLLPGLLGGGVFGLAFLIGAALLGSPELALLSAGVRRRLRKAS